MKKKSFLPRQHKYRARRTLYAGDWYDSQLEANHARTLDILRKAKDPKERVMAALRQWPFKLPGDIFYKCDFLVIYDDGHWEYHECKGYETPAFKLKMKLMAANYPESKIKIIKAGRR